MTTTPEQIDRMAKIWLWHDEQVGHFSPHTGHLVSFTRCECDPYRRVNSTAQVLCDAVEYRWTDRVS